MPTLEFEVIADGLGFPEGPVAMGDGSVIVVEIAAGRVSRVWGDGRRETVAETGGGPNGAALGPDGALYVCNNGGMDARLFNRSGPGAEGRVERIDLATGKLERLCDQVDGRPFSAPNDLVFDKAGGLWFTDLGKTLVDTIEYSGLYYMAPGGSAVARHHWGPYAYNGVGLSPDEGELYVADTRTARLWSFALEAPGRMAPADAASRSRRKLVATSPGNVSLDSLAVTASGAVCVGTLGHAGEPGGVSVFRPEAPQAAQVERLAFPDPMVTNICFGGADMRTAFMTFSITGKLVRARWPEPGLKLNFQQA